MNLRPPCHPWQLRGRKSHLGRGRLLSLALALALSAALPAAPALAQSPEPSATATSGTTPDPAPTATPAPRWLLYLPAIHQPVKELLLGQEARVGGAAMGIATDGRSLFQVQGASLHSWVPDGPGDELTYRGAFDLLDPAPVDDAWLSLEGGLVTYLRQLRERVPGEPPRSTPFLRLSLLTAGSDGATTAGANLDLPGRLAAQARSADRLYLSVDDPDDSGHALLTVDVSRWEDPRLIHRQALPASARQLLAFPETGQLLALASGAGGTELWTWSAGGDGPRNLSVAPLPLGTEPAALLRVPEGVLAIDSAGSGLVIPLRSRRLRLDRARAADFPLDAVDGPGNRSFVTVDGAAWVAEQVCLYHGIHISTHAASRMVNNLLACFGLPTDGPPVLRRVLAADRLIDVPSWQNSVHLAVVRDQLILSRGSPGGMEVFWPLSDAGPLEVQTADWLLPGRVEGVLRQGDRLVTVEGDAQLRAWAFDEAAYGHLRPLSPSGPWRLGLPGAGNLITRDLPPAADIPNADLVLWREGGLAITGQLQRVRLGEDPPFQEQAAETVMDWRFGLRAAGNLLWSNQDGRIWRFGTAGHVPLTLPNLRGSLQDVAHLGSLRLLAAGVDGLLVLDGADQVIGRLALPGPATAIAVDALRTSSVVWVATGGLPAVSPEPRGSTALHCLDLSDPTAPRPVASIDLPGDRVDRLRAAGAKAGNPTATGARVVGSGWQRRTADLFAYDDPLLFLVDAQDCAHPRLEGATRWDGPPGFLGEPYAEPRLGWDLNPDGQRLYAARDGVEVYGLGGQGHDQSANGRGAAAGSQQGSNLARQMKRTGVMDSPHWTIYLPSTPLQRPFKKLTLRLEGQRLGGSATGIAAVGQAILQVQGDSVLTWLPTAGDDGWTLKGRLDLEDAYAIDRAWISSGVGTACIIAQMSRHSGAPDTFVRIRQVRLGAAGAETASDSLDLPGSMTAYARLGDNIYLAVEGSEAGEHHVHDVNLSTWRPTTRWQKQEIPGSIDSLLALPETSQLLALGHGVAGMDLWTWDIHSGQLSNGPRNRLKDVHGGKLVRIPEGVAAIGGGFGGASGRVIPLRDGSLQFDAARTVWFDDAVTDDGRQFQSAGSGAPTWVSGLICLYQGIDESPRTFKRTHHNVLACYSLEVMPPETPQPLRQLVAADITLEDWWTSTAVVGDSILLSRGGLGGIEVLGPIGGATPPSARTLDVPGGMMTSVLRRGNHLITTEGDLQLRTWLLDPAKSAVPRPVSRLGLPNAGSLISRDLPIDSSLMTRLVLFRGFYIGYPGEIQQVQLSSDGSLGALAATALPDIIWDARAGGGFFWSLSQIGNQDVWRLGTEPLEPIVHLGIPSTVRDLAVAGRHRVLATHDQGLLILDADDRILGQLPLAVPASAIAVDTEGAPANVWVATGGPPNSLPASRDMTQLHCVDIGDPASPRLVSSIDLQDLNVDRLRAAGGRLVGSGTLLRKVDDLNYYDRFLISIDARDCNHPVVGGMTSWESYPDIRGGTSFSWDLSSDGRQLYATRVGPAAGLGVYQIIEQP